MGNQRQRMPIEVMRRKILYHAALSFLEVGYTDTYLKDLADKVGINIGSLIHLFPHKEDILLALVDIVIGEQFTVATSLTEGQEADPAFLYVMDTALELNLAESAEHLRDLYVSAYTIPVTANRIYELMKDKVRRCFEVYNPALTAEDFYELEIGSSALMRGYISVPCTKEFPIQQKVRRFHEAALRMYRVPEEKIASLLEAAEKMDFVAIAAKTLEQMQANLND